eukprot:6246835-Prymnesium_polylepis.1
MYSGQQYRVASDALKLILAGKKVPFLCRAGLNRSPTLARMASRGMKFDGVPMPVDEALCELALCEVRFGRPLRCDKARAGGRAQAAQAACRDRTLRVVC